MPQRTTSVDARELMDIVHTLPDVLFRCEKGSDGRIRWTLNEGKLAEEFHLTTREIAGKTLDEMFPPDVVARIKPEFEAAFRGEAREFVNELGGRFFKHYPQPLRDERGDVVAVVGFISEVTSLQRAQDDLARANRDLEAFSYTVSHDLRTPLTAAQNFARLLKREEGLSEEGRRYVERIETSHARMKGIIEDVLKLTRAAAAPLAREEVPIGRYVTEAIATLQAAEPGRHVAVDVDERAVALGDPQLLRLVVDNLVGNAWKFTRERDDARIEFGAVASPAGTTFYVRDNGAGFDPARAADLFQTFSRLPEHTGFEGSGIGLATVARVVERHHGRVWAEGRTGEGATFSFTLP